MVDEKQVHIRAFCVIPGLKWGHLEKKEIFANILVYFQHEIEHLEYLIIRQIPLNYVLYTK